MYSNYRQHMQHIILNATHWLETFFSLCAWLATWARRRGGERERERVRGNLERKRLPYYLSNLLDQFVIRSFVVLKALCKVWLFELVQSQWWCWRAASSSTLHRKVGSKRDSCRFYYIFVTLWFALWVHKDWTGLSCTILWMTNFFFFLRFSIFRIKTDLFATLLACSWVPSDRVSMPVRLKEEESTPSITLIL